MRDQIEPSVTIDGIPFIGTWWSVSETGLSFGIKTGLSRNVHVTAYIRNDIFNCHITDTTKDPKKIWEMEMSLSDLEALALEFINSSTKRYYWHQWYYQLCDDFPKAYGYSEEMDDYNIPDYDIRSVLEVISRDDFLVKKRIRKGFSEGFKPGLIFKGDDVYMVIPMDKNKMFMLNADIRKTVLWNFPFPQGLFRYLDYIDQENLLEQSDRYSKEKIDQIGATLLGVLDEYGITPEEYFSEE